MAEPSPIQLALDLAKHGAQMEQAWITRFIAVNGGLASAVGALLAYRVPGSELLFRVLLIGICVIAIVSSVLLREVILRQHSWQASHISRIKELQSKDAQLIPEDPRLEGISISCAIRIATPVIVLVWAALLVTLVLPHFS